MSVGTKGKELREGLKHQMGEEGREPRKHVENSGKGRYVHSEGPCLPLRLQLVRTSAYGEETRSRKPALLRERGRLRELSVYEVQKTALDFY